MLDIGLDKAERRDVVELALETEIENLERQIAKTMKMVHATLAHKDIGGHFYFKITASGPVQRSELKIEYELYKDWENKTEGNSIAPVVREFIRREEWNSLNAAKLLSHAGTEI